MNRLAWLSISILLLGAAAFLVSLNGCGKGSATFTVPPPVSKIQHVVIIFQENRTPDNLFQDPVLIASPRNADIQSYGVNSLGKTITLSQIDLGTNGSNPDNYDVNHDHISFTQMCDLNPATNVCKMDGADKITTGCATGVTGCAPPNPQFRYVKPSDVQPRFRQHSQIHRRKIRLVIAWLCRCQQSGRSLRLL